MPMPELPEVETVRRGLVPALLGRRLAQVSAHRPDLRFPLPPRFAARLEGRRVEAIDRRAKYLLIGLEDNLTLLVHLGMSGRFQVAAEDGPRCLHDHVCFVTDDGWTVRFNDARRFGYMDLVATERLADHPLLASLGPEPLGESFTASYLASRLAGRAMALKAALMDQRTVAGMGNIYASESLYRARLSPLRPSGSVSGAGARRLVSSIRAVLSEAIEAGGSTLRNHQRPTGELGCFQHSFAVYDRAGLPCPDCRCEVARTGGIQRTVIAGRATFHCRKRQR
jgi:formamidopyrimidine-DNA glycosylase